MVRESSVAGDGARYDIIGPLGAGGSGAVYEARDRRSGLLVALKELRENSGQSVVRFKQEFRALSGFHHPNLVSLKELIEQDGRWLIVMELVPGTDFLAYVARADNDNDARFDETRLRHALIGMVEGLRALHGRGILHRDLKPANVKVTPEGRAVLLDFGLATTIDPVGQSTHKMAVGTAAYMAPEQAVGSALGPEADLYALGVCLFQGLTGQIPFGGTSALDILLRKQREEPPRASSLALAVPADLDDLCTRLLSTQPTARPTLGEVHALLTGRVPSIRPPALSAAPSPAPGRTFAGREGELQRLSLALSQTQAGALRIVLVEGESGVGKSELVAEFLRRTRASEPSLLTLSGRCYENEQVSYKAFDGCIDELARFLQRLPKPDCAALLPLRSALLAQLFPVLREVKQIADAPSEGSSADPTARRLEAFAALTTLLSNLAAEQPLVLVMDDLQWADAESYRLLTALVTAPEPPALLLLATIRPRAELEPDVLASVSQVRQWQLTSVVELHGLPLEEAQALARQLFGRPVTEQWLTALVRESEGHPLFLAELVHFAQTHDLNARGTLTLEQALHARISRLESRSRALFELVALAARPHGSHVFAQALGVDSVDESARSLLQLQLLRLRKGQELSCYHDRIRHAAVALIARARLPALHRQLALALARTQGTDEAEQARHWDLSGETEQAIEAYDRASAKALDALAFARAEQLCARALELIGGAFDARSRDLTVRRARALASAGNSAEAAKLYEQAADRIHGEERLRLRSKAAQHLVLSSDIVGGLEAVRTVLYALGFRLPKRPLAAILRFAWDALRLFVQRVPRRASAEAARLQTTLDVATDLSYVIATVHPLSYPLLMVQSMRRALTIGTPLSLAKAAVWRSWLRALQGEHPSKISELSALRATYEAQADAASRAAYEFVEASSYLSVFDWAEAAPRLETAQKILQEQCPDRTWVLLSVRHSLGSTWYNLGEYVRLAEAVERWILEARERNDHVSVALLAGLGFGFARHLMVDAPDTAVAEITDAMAHLPGEPYAFLHLGQFVGMSFSLLYRGGPDALRWIERNAQEHQGALMMRTAVARQARLFLRSLALLAAARTASGPERSALLDQARRGARQLQKGRSPFGRGVAALVSAQIEALAGDRVAALAHARTCRVLFEELHNGHRFAARYLEGVLIGGDAGRDVCKVAIGELATRGWREPWRHVQMIMPLLGELDTTPVLARAPSTLIAGRYEVVDALGGGGFGTVVRARDVRTGRTLALKELTREGGVPLERFKREFRTLQQIDHQNLVHIESLLVDDGRWFMVMEAIEGEDFLGYVRPHGVLDVGRLYAALAGVVDGLSALHAHGFVHRDVSPQNVRVTREGRAVLLDFGLVARIGHESESGPVGTPEYAAPEQLTGVAPDPSADVYALGCCLYRALSGRSPFEGTTPIELVEQKQTADLPAPPLGPSPVLSAWCLRMLARAPAERPTLEQTSALLRDGREDRAEPEQTISDGAVETQFGGREPELSALEEAFDRTGDDGLRLVLVEGESGLGKSALVAEFAARTTDGESGRVCVLRSRCYENEQVALKAFDGAVDELARFLRELPNPRCEAVLPKRSALLGQLFPVLTSVPAIAQAPKRGLPADPSARRRLARQCFVELLRNLGARQLELLFVVDDLQWADSESFRLLSMLLEHGRELPFLIVCTTRPESELDEPTAAELRALRARPEASVITLTGLSARAASALARELFGAELSGPACERIVRESKGHPMFLRELVEQERRGEDGPVPGLTLDAALSARSASFAPEARELLALVALSGKPLESHVFARALGVGALPWPTVAVLLRSGMLRRRGAQELACQHDRVRQVVLDGLAPAQRRALARKLAAALDVERSSDPADRARLWDEAGCHAEAIAAYEQAGQRALETLAFVRAEQHYARALALLADHDAQTRDEGWRRLVVQRGHALVRAGRSAEAARAYGEAAIGAEGEEHVRLRIWAAQHLIQSAQIEEGLRAAHALLSELGEPLPEGERRTLLRLVWESARLKLRGRKLSVAKRTPASERLLLEALHGLVQPLTAVATMTGLTAALCYLRHALDAGEAEPTARALAIGAMWRVMQDPNHDSTEAFEQSRALADESGNPELRAHVEVGWGLTCLQNDMKSAPTHLAIAHELLSTRCPGEPWQLTIARMNLGSAWYFTGNYGALARETGAWIDDARDRDDRYAFAALTGFGGGALRHVMAGEPQVALDEIADAMRPWPTTHISTVHLGAFTMQRAARVALHRTAPDPGLLAWVAREEATLRRSLLMRAPALRLALHQAWLFTLPLAIEPGQQPTPEVRKRFEREVAAIGRNVSQPARGVALLGRAIASTFAGEHAHALTQVRDARVALATTGHYAERGAVYLEGWLDGGERGQATCSSALASFTAQGFQDPRVGLALALPGAHLFER